jgi:hypothetical protein
VYASNLFQVASFPQSIGVRMIGATMPPINVVLDTNVVIAAMRSRRGASFRLLSLDR